MNDSQRLCLRTHGTLLGRALLGLLFVFSGVGMLLGGVENVTGMIANVGVPLAGLVAWVVVIVKVVAGLALILGYRVGLAAGALTVFTLLTILFFHMDYKNDINFFKNLSIIGGLFYVMAYGPGDGWRLQK